MKAMQRYPEDDCLAKIRVMTAAMGEVQRAAVERDCERLEAAVCAAADAFRDADSVISQVVQHGNQSAESSAAIVRSAAMKLSMDVTGTRLFLQRVARWNAILANSAVEKEF